MNYLALLAEVARELGYEQLWTTLTTTMDAHIAAISEAGSRTRQELPPALRDRLVQIETTLSSCYEQLRVAAEHDLMAHFLLSHSRAGNVPPKTFAQRFETAGRLRQLAEKWKVTLPVCSETARQMADDLEEDLVFEMYVDHESENALAEQVHGLGGIIIPTTWRGWPFPRLTLPLPPRRRESVAEVEAQMAREDRRKEGWEQAVTDRICSPPYWQLSFWFPQVISEEELSLSENRIDAGFPGLFTSDEWPMIQLQAESPPIQVKRPWFLSCNATYQDFRCHWEEEDFTPDAKANFQDRLATLRGLFIRLHQWCQDNLVPLGEYCFCGPKIWKNNERFRRAWEEA